MTIVASNSITVSNVNDGTITHTAYANSADGTNGFTTVYPNLNLLAGTKDFSGTWTNSSSWVTDGTYKGLTVKKRTAQWGGIYKTFTAPKDGSYIFSTYIKSSGNAANIYRYGGVNTTSSQPIIQKLIGNNFDWTIDSITLNLKANDSMWIRYEISGSGTDSILWVAGYKYEPGSTATPWMPSASEVTTADWPSYIGQYTDFTQADSTNPSDYTWSLIRGNDGKDGADGKDGIAGKDGVGIKTTDITYAISTSGTTAPTSGWTSSVPSLVKGQYLWTKTVWTYTDNSSKTGYSVTYISKDGNNGNDGIAGKDGVGILTTTITYAGSTSGTTAPTSGWSTTVPTVAAGSYLWTKTVWAYTDNTSETGYSVAKMGNDGATGPQGLKGDPGATGIPGQAGADGKTSYLHIAYATNSTGTAGFDVSNATGKTYIGQYTDFTSADSTDPSKYIWSLIKGDKGDKGDQGDQGPAGSDGNPGKIVSDTEPTTRFKGLTWKYSGTTDLTASDGTVIKSNTEYYYNGTHWIINLIEANQLNVNDLSAISGTFTNGSIKNVTTDGSVTSTILIEKKHILFTFSDSSQNTTNTLELDSQQGYANTFVDSNSGRTRTVQANFQGFFTSDTDGPSAQLTPYGVYVTNGLQTTTVSLGSGINATLAKIGQMCQISINSNSSNVPAGNGVALSGNIPAGWRPAIGTPFEVMMYSGTAFQRPLHITIGTDGKLSIVNASASSYWCFGGTTYMLA